jgi:2,3-dihydroxybenzoate decarboxylase
MLGKIALEEAWAIPENFKAYDPTTLAPKGVIGGDLAANLMDVHGTRLQQMDENGVDLMVLSLSSPGAQGEADPDSAATLATLANDRMADEVARNPARFAGMVSVAMHDPVVAAEELKRCFEGKKGFVGVMVNDFQTCRDAEGKEGMIFYDSAEYDPFWAEAERLDCPVYVHPRAAAGPIHEMMWKGRPWLEFSALGYAQRVAMHVLGIVTSGVLDRFPKVKIVVGHMGEQIPYDLYRIDHKLNRARFADMPMRKDRCVRDYFGSQLFITTSGHFSTPALVCAVQEVGVRAVMFAIDYPFESIPNGSVWFDEYVKMNGRDLVDIGRNNALEVFPRLAGDYHGLKRMGPTECQVGGIGVRKEDHGRAMVEYGLYNESWDKREVRR